MNARCRPSTVTAQQADTDIDLYLSGAAVAR
jgi:hypothetical protein